MVSSIKKVISETLSKKKFSLCNLKASLYFLSTFYLLTLSTILDWQISNCTCVMKLQESVLLMFHTVFFPAIDLTLFYERRKQIKNARMRKKKSVEHLLSFVSSASKQESFLT